MRPGDALATTQTRVYSKGVGSKTFDGVRFSAYTDYHPPSHIHAFYAGVEVILELVFSKKSIRLAGRKDRTRPANAKRSDVNYIVETARANRRKIYKVWEEAQ